MKIIFYNLFVPIISLTTINNNAFVDALKKLLSDVLLLLTALLPLIALVGIIWQLILRSHADDATAPGINKRIRNLVIIGVAGPCVTFLFHLLLGYFSGVSGISESGAVALIPLINNLYLLV